MLCFIKLPIQELNLTFDPWPEYQAKIRAKLEYQQLSKSIAKEGILDPLLVRFSNQKMIVETGTQRLMIARDLGISELRCFVYADEIPQKIIEDSSCVLIESKSQLGLYFRNGEVNCLLDILGYLSDQTIVLQKAG